MNKIIITIFIAVFSIFISGCSGNYPLKGRVTFSDDGAPLETGFVNFENEKGFARGELKKNGNYQVGFVGEKDGIPPGTYKVYISGTTIEDPTDRNKVIMLVDSRQCRADTSGWILTIDGSVRVYDFKVDRPPK
jgi:hypothetical protein